MLTAPSVRPPSPGLVGPVRWQASLGGLLAGALALVVAEAVARAVPGGVSPVVAVAGRVVALTPGSASRPAIDAFGSLDKPLLLGGVLLVAGLLSAWGGRLAVVRPAAADGLVCALAAVVLLAQVTTPGAGPGAVLVAIALLVPALLGLRWLRPPAHAEDRRAFLLRAGLATAGVVTGAFVTRWLDVRQRVGALRADVVLPPTVRPAPGDVAAADLGVPGQPDVLTPNEVFYRIDTALTVPQVDPGDWSLQVTGLVDAPYALSFADLLALPQVEADITLSCVSNEVGGDLVGTARWQGVLLRDVLARAGVQDGAEQVVGRSVDGFTAGFPLSVARDGRPALVAVAMNGVPLPVEHGFPARLVVPGLYGYVSATKWLTEIAVTTLDVDGYWVPRGWSKQGPIKTSSRIDVPRGDRDVPAGEVVVAGVAWAPTRGIASVEVRVDGGPWRAATLAPALSDDTWVQWRLGWDAGPGEHLLEVRATDGRGDVQTRESAPPAPDGATGYHRLDLRVV